MRVLECPGRRETTGTGTPFITAWLAWGVEHRRRRALGGEHDRRWEMRGWPQHGWIASREIHKTGVQVQ